MLKIYDDVSKNQNFAVAVSGGIDSMVLADFLRRSHRGRMTIIHVNHGTAYANKAEEFVGDWAIANNIPIITHNVTSKCPSGQSKEEFWRDQRYKFFRQFEGPVLLGHHLNDVMETWVFSCMNGTPSLMRYSNGNCIRPLLLTARSKIEEFARIHSIPFIEDPSNTDVKFARNRIRHNILPEILMVNPGLEKVLRRKLIERRTKEEAEAI